MFSRQPGYSWIQGYCVDLVDSEMVCTSIGFDAGGNTRKTRMKEFTRARGERRRAEEEGWNQECARLHIKTAFDVARPKFLAKVLKDIGVNRDLMAAMLAEMRNLRGTAWLRVP